MITLTDMYGESFTEGDRVVYGSTNGLRVGKVDYIREVKPSHYSAPYYRVYIDLSEHHRKDEASPTERKVVSSAVMYNRRQGYDYHENYFMKLS